MPESFLIKLQALACNFIKKETLSQVFSCDICIISKNTFSYTSRGCFRLIQTTAKNFTSSQFELAMLICLN